PYAILVGSLPEGKMGYYVGVFNFFIVIPQIVASIILGFILKHVFSDQTIYAFVIGGVSMVVAAVLCLLVKDND
ncbi:MAG TPA: MFS transporter, partial [Flavobacteriales bacterium]|nr:MFS transporter [Flavobacteriales bacterium]